MRHAVFPAIGALAPQGCALRPAAAIDVELAKKCRAMAIPHPPQMAGTKPYATAEREFFNRCVSAKGKMRREPARIRCLCGANFFSPSS
jgi:hypothetical protein